MAPRNGIALFGYIFPIGSMQTARSCVCVCVCVCVSAVSVDCILFEVWCSTFNICRMFPSVFLCCSSFPVVVLLHFCLFLFQCALFWRCLYELWIDLHAAVTFFVNHSAFPSTYLSIYLVVRRLVANTHTHANKRMERDSSTRSLCFFIYLPS